MLYKYILPLAYLVDFSIFARKYQLMKSTLLSIWKFYADGFRNMTWGRPLWGLIFLKIVILFFILRLFFFQPALSGKTEEQKIDHVGNQLTQERIENKL